MTLAMSDPQPIVAAQIVCCECGSDSQEGCWCDLQELYGAPEPDPAPERRSGYDWRQELRDEAIREGL